MAREKTLEEKIEYIKELRPIDDAFFELLSQDQAVVEEMLRTILEDPGLSVDCVESQETIANAYGRAVRLDCLCTLSDGTSCNIEVQRADDDDHFKRVRVNEAGVTWKATEKGTSFKETPDVIVVYISEFDILKGEKTTYHVDKVVRETGQIIEDGTTNIYVNTKVKDGSNTSELMNLFLQKEVNNPKFPKLSYRVNYLKNNQEGVRAMCDVVKRYAADEVREVTEKYSAIIAQKDASLAQKDASLAQKDASLAQKDSQIADLMRQLHEAQQKK